MSDLLTCKLTNQHDMKTNSNKIFNVLWSLIILTVCSCGKDESREKIISTQEVEIEAYASSRTIAIDELISSISDIDNTVDWLSVELQPYESGAPQIKIIWTDNDEANKRTATILINTKEKDQITFLVTQHVKTGTNDLHNLQTDQPAYSAIR